MSATIEHMTFWKKLSSRFRPDVPVVKDDSEERRVNLLANQIQQQQIEDDAARLEKQLGVNGFTARFMLASQMKAQEAQ